MKLLYWFKVNIIIIAAFVFLAGFLAGFYFIFHGVDHDIIIDIKPGWGLKNIAGELKSNGAIESKWLFVFYSLMSGDDGKFQAGRYLIKKGLNMMEVIEMIVRGSAIKNEASAAIPEGYNMYQIADKLEKAGLVKKFDFLNLINNPQNFSDKYKFLSCDKSGIYGCPKNLEGYLFPDTYNFDKNVTAQAVIEKFLGNFEKKIGEELFYSIYQSDRSLYDIIIMASLIEKEVKTFADMEIASGILWKRLKAGVALQVDASVVYAKCVNAESSDNCKIEPPLIEDLKIKSPYNTYLYNGLPLAAISNPGLSAIQASVYPKKSDYWYYLTAKDGATIFSRTLEEHNLNKAKYLK